MSNLWVQTHHFDGFSHPGKIPFFWNKKFTSIQENVECRRGISWALLASMFVVLRSCWRRVVTEISRGFASVVIRGILLKFVRILIHFLLLYLNSQCHFRDFPTKFSWMCLRDSNFWTVVSLGTKFWRWFIECIWVLSLELVYTLVYVCKFCQNYKNGFCTLVLALFVGVFEGLKLLKGWNFGYWIFVFVYWVYLGGLNEIC